MRSCPVKNFLNYVIQVGYCPVAGNTQSLLENASKIVEKIGLHKVELTGTISNKNLINFPPDEFDADTDID
jgi:hypothetical protein